MISLTINTNDHFLILCYIQLLFLLLGTFYTLLFFFSFVYSQLLMEYSPEI